MIKKTNEEFLKELLEKNEGFKNKNFIVVDKYKSSHIKILLKDKFGYLKVKPYSLLNGWNPTISSAIDKNSYYINKCREVHGNKYDYSKVIYNRNNKITIICKKHGEFLQTPASHLMGVGCSICGVDIVKEKTTFNINTYTKKAKVIHGDMYTYENFKCSNSLMTLKCNIHGDFDILPTYHLQGTKCPKCTTIARIEKNRLNPTGWSISRWVSVAESNKEKFDSYKVYLIKCYNEKENFYKIGRTYKKIKERFYGKQMPYNYDLINLIEFNNGERAYHKEIELKRIFKHNKYLPKINFNGMYECFNNDIDLKLFK